MINHTRTRRSAFFVACVLAILVIGQAVTSQEQGTSPSIRQFKSLANSHLLRTRRTQAQAAQTELHKAARTGKVTVLRARLQEGMNPDVRDQDGRTPLMDAVKAGQVEAARVLLEVRGESECGIVIRADRSDRSRRIGKHRRCSSPYRCRR